MDGWNPDKGTWSDPSEKGYVVTRLFEKLRNGAGDVNSAQYAGVNYKTVYLWREKGKAIAESTSVEDRMDLPLGDRIYVDFAFQWATAVATSEIEFVDVLAEGARKDPELALKFLARRWPHWREQKGVDVTSKGESVVVQDRIAELLGKDPTLAAKGEDLYLSVAAAAGEDELDDEDA